MNEFFKQNLWAILITLVGVVSTFTLYGYRIDALEKQTNDNQQAIQVLNTQQTQVQVQLAQIATDISYIKVNLDRILK